VRRKNSEFSPPALEKFFAWLSRRGGSCPRKKFQISRPALRISLPFTLRNQVGIFSNGLKNFAFLFFSCLPFLCFPAATLAQSETLQRNDSERELFELLNRERTAQGIPELRWDDALFKAARRHALLMLNLNMVEHQLPGESTLEERLTAAGARFTLIEENIAVGKDSSTIHAGWMNSPGHRRSILEPRVTAVGIAAVRGSAGLFAVEDFSQLFLNLSLEQQEKQVTALFAAKGWSVSRTPEDARKACKSNTGVPGRSWSVVQFDTTDLGKFPPDLEKKIEQEPYRNVAVGACHTSEAAGFAHYRIALVFF
jgi:uncharacterized protein YkwD